MWPLAGFRKWINERGCVMADTEDLRCQPGQGSIGLVQVALTDLSGGHQVANLFSLSTQCCIRTFQDSLQAIAVTKF